MEKIKVNMSPNPLDVQTIHASQNDGEARQWEFELHNNGEVIDAGGITEQMVFKSYKGGTEQILPENGAVPVTAPFVGDIKYPDTTRNDQEFLYRQSPTEKDGNAKITDIKGNTLVWNQLVEPIRPTNTVAGITFTNNGDGSFTLNGTATGNTDFRIDQSISADNLKSYSAGTYIMLNDLHDGVWLSIMQNTTWANVANFKSNERIVTLQNNIDNCFIFFYILQGTTLNNVKIYPQITNITKLGSSAITDLASFKSFYNLPYYSYNQGSLLSFNGNGIKTVGKNLCDNSTIITGYYTWQNLNQDTNYKTSALIPVFPNTTYIGTIFDKNKNPLNRLVYTEWDSNGNYIQQSIAPSLTTSSNTAFVRIRNFSGQTPNILNDDFLFQLEIGSTPSNYEPYTETITDLPISTYFPTGMKRAGNVYDELTESKAITRIGAVDLGSLNWTYYSQRSNFYAIISDMVVPSPNSRANAKYPLGNPVTWYEMLENNNDNNTFAIAEVSGEKRFYIKNTAYTDVTAFKTAMSGVYLYYELATPTETSFTTASLVTENAEIPLSNNDGVLIGKCTEQLSENPGFIDAKIKLTDSDGECYSNKIQLHIERSPQ